MSLILHLGILSDMRRFLRCGCSLLVAVGDSDRLRLRPFDVSLSVGRDSNGCLFAVFLLLLLRPFDFNNFGALSRSFGRCRLYVLIGLV